MHYWTTCSWRNKEADVLSEVPVSIPLPTCERQQDFHRLYVFPLQSEVLVPYLPLCDELCHHVVHVFQLAAGDERIEMLSPSQRAVR